MSFFWLGKQIDEIAELTRGWLKEIYDQNKEILANQEKILKKLEELEQRKP